MLVSCECCVLGGERPLRGSVHSFRRVLPSVCVYVCVCVCVCVFSCVYVCDPENSREVSLGPSWAAVKKFFFINVLIQGLRLRPFLFLKKLTSVKKKA